MRLHSPCVGVSTELFGLLIGHWQSWLRHWKQNVLFPNLSSNGRSALLMSDEIEISASNVASWHCRRMISRLLLMVAGVPKGEIWELSCWKRVKSFSQASRASESSILDGLLDTILACMQEVSAMQSRRLKMPIWRTLSEKRSVFDVNHSLNIIYLGDRLIDIMKCTR